MSCAQEMLTSEVYTNLNLTATDSSSSDSDHGYVTPVEHFADDEQHIEQEERALSLINTRSPVVSDGLVVVEPELLEKIVQQVEWYFSDDNLLKDSFLMKHINRNKQGYVSLKLVASLRKVKALTKDWRVVLQSLKESSVLVLNDEESKVRRTEAAPQVDYTHVNRTILVTNYPSNEPTIQEIEQRFGNHGEVTLVRILHPGRAIPLDVKPCRGHHPDIGKELCILVEFESEEGAKKACKKFLDQQSWRDEVKVQLLGEKKTAAKEKLNEVSQSEPKSPPAKSGNKRRRKKSDNEKKDQQPQTSRWLKDDSSSRYTSEASPSPRHSREGSPSKQPQRRYSPPSYTDSRRWQHSAVRSFAEPGRKLLHPDAHKEYASDSGYSRSSSESPKSSPEPMKRFFSGDVGPAWRKAEKHVHVKDSCVVRQPIGPDGSRGFGPRRAPIQISVQVC